MSVNRRVAFEDNSVLVELYGVHDRNLARIEQLANVQLRARANQVEITGETDDVAVAHKALTSLYERLKRGLTVETADVDAAVRFATAGLDGEEEGIRTRRRTINARSPGQREYLEALRERDMVFALGPAGSGKTYLAVAMGVSLLTAGKVERIVLSRPAVEAGERLGFLPGDMKDKVERAIAAEIIEIAPLAFMRGRTLAHAAVILDEAQNTTPMQMKMFLTRLGENARMIVTGDPTQIDLPPNTKSGLVEALRILEGVPGIVTVRFNETDVVRHPLVAEIVQAYERDSKLARGAGLG